MTDRTAIRLAKGLFALIVVQFLVSNAVALYLMSQGVFTPREILPDIGFSAALMSFPVVGVIVALRQPRNAIGWVLLGVGFAWQISGVLDAYGAWGDAHPGEAPGYEYALAFSSWAWIPGLGPLGTFLLLLFPDGHLPTPRWRWWARLSGACMALACLGILFGPGPIDGEMANIENPMGLEFLRPVMFLIYIPILAIPICIVGCAVALVRRFRRSRGVQRLQLKWLAAAAATVASVYLAAMIASIPYNWATGAHVPLWISLLQNGSLLSFMLLPVAVGVAITRHRLYDIDRLINRALVYGAVSASLVAVYVLGVVGVGAALRAVTGSEQGNLAVAGSTLAVAALFGPFRARVQGFIDRRFYRRKYDAALTVEAFSVRLRQETDLSTLSEELRDVVRQTVQPASVEIWIAAR